jgi:hypothetical protein
MKGWCAAFPDDRRRHGKFEKFPATPSPKKEEIAERRAKAAAVLKKSPVPSKMNCSLCG